MKIMDLWPSKNYPVLREVIVNLKDDVTSFQGVVWARRGRYLVLRNASIRVKGDSKKVDGEVAVLEDDVLFIQVLN